MPTKSKVHVTKAGTDTGRDPFEAHPPPYHFESQLVLALGACPAEPLLRTFPDLDLCRMGDRALVGVWFARVHDLRSGDQGQRRIGEPPQPGELPYHELTVAVLLRHRRLFVPGIYATSGLTVELGQRYGMPKSRARMSFHVRGGRLISRLKWNGAESRIRACRLPGGGPLGYLLRHSLPWWTWPALFPGGSHVRSLIESFRRVRPAWLAEGRIDLAEAWLPRPVRLWRLGLYLDGQTMRLPHPAEGEGGGFGPR